VKLPVYLSFFSFVCAFLFGCNFVNHPISSSINPPSSITPILITPTTPLVIQPVYTPEPTPSSNAIPLEIENLKILLEFVQNGSSVPISADGQNLWKVSLKPEPFTLMVYGDKNLVSVSALKSIEMSLPLQDLSKPLITTNGTGNGFGEHRLFLFDQTSDMRIYDLPTFFTKYFKSHDTTELSDYIKGQFNIEPVVYMSSHTYLKIKLGGETNYTISSIGNKEISNYVQSGNSMALVVFIEKDLGESMQIKVKQLKWVIFKLGFQ
jgi:hypothetical protein